MNRSLKDNIKKNLYKPSVMLLGITVWLCWLPVLAYGLCGQDSQDDYYGNAETCLFKNAVESTEALTAEDQAFMNATQAIRMINRGYLRVWGGWPKTQLLSLQIQPTNTSDLLAEDFTTPTTSVTSKAANLSITTGYFWEQWAIEPELYFAQKLNFTLEPTYLNYPFTVQGSLNEVAAFMNIEYVLPRLFTWYPSRLQVHFSGGVGPVLKVMNLTASALWAGIPDQNGSNRAAMLAGQLSVGARYQMAPHWLIQTTYRYLAFGKTKFLLPESEYDVDCFLLAKKTQVTGYFIGLVYQF